MKSRYVYQEREEDSKIRSSAVKSLHSKEKEVAIILCYNT